jgi:hypothetical protein
MVPHTRFRVAFLATALILAAGLMRAPDAAAGNADEGWIALFNGKDFTGWKIPDPPSGNFKKGVKEVKNAEGKVVAFVATENDKKGKGKDEVVKGKEITLWQIKDGMIVGGGPASHIFTELEADDFHYRIEAKINDKGNSGQYFRTQFGPGYPKGYEAQINSTFPDPQKTGSLYNFVKITDMLVEPDTWFTQEVIANGNHIQIILNGKKVVDFNDEKNTHTKGHFALQQHGPAKDGPDVELQVKRIEVKELPKTSK